MFFLQTIILLFVFQAFIVCNNSYAQTIKYSMGPSCKGSKVVCPNLNEVPTCIVLNPRVHLDMNEKLSNRYKPSCGFDLDSSQPGCVDIFVGEEANSKFAQDVVVECIEKAKCEVDKDTNKLITSCSNGKIAKCLGSDNTPNCANDFVCGNNSSMPVCDYVWQANLSESGYQ